MIASETKTDESIVATEDDDATGKQKKTTVWYKPNSCLCVNQVDGGELDSGVNLVDIEN